jgi:membrane protease YdiL (CAAX protease family)
MSDPAAEGNGAGAPTVVLATAAPGFADPPPMPATAAPAARPPRVFGNFALDVLIGTLLLFAYSMAFSLPVIAYAMIDMPPAVGGTAPDVEAVANGAMAELAVAAIFAMLATALTLWLLRGRRLVDPQPPMATLPAYGLAALAGLVIQACGVGISLLAAHFEVPLDPTNAAPLMDLTQKAPWLAWFAVVLVAPFSEELLFRHVLLRRFVVAGRGVFGLLATALLFAYLHEPTPWLSDWRAWLVTTSTYIAMGLGFGAIYLRTRRLGAAFVAHATCNLLAMVLLAFSSS